MQHSSLNITLTPDAQDWLTQLRALEYAYGKPSVLARLKVSPEDFRVDEILTGQLSGEGEHFWLDISKTKQNTDQVAKLLARFAGVAYRDVSYAGLKDYFAQTRQWFSVWMPRGPMPDWSEFEAEGIVVHEVTKHDKKLRRGSHSGNRFAIELREIQSSSSSSSDSSSEELEERLLKVQSGGVPNYFGEQRFGRNADNMRQAVSMLVDGQRVKNKSLRGLLISSARSWLFNQVVSARVKQRTWNSLRTPEPANLSGSNSFFVSNGEAQELERLDEFDIHPTAPLCGDGAEKAMQNCDALHSWEQDVLRGYTDLYAALVAARIDYSRRATRSFPANLEWQFREDSLHLTFELGKGQYATSVLRELVQTT